MELFFNLDRGGGELGVLVRLISPERRKEDRGRERGREPWSHPCSKIMSMRPAPARAREPHVRLRESATVGVPVDRATAAELAISLACVLRR